MLALGPKMYIICNMYMCFHLHLDKQPTLGYLEPRGQGDETPNKVTAGGLGA